GQELGLDLEGGDVLAAAADRVLEPIDEDVLALGIDMERIPRMEPAVPPGPRGRFGIVVVAVAHRPRARRAQDHLADRAPRYLAIVLVDEADLDAGAPSAAPARLGRVGAGEG